MIIKFSRESVIGKSRIYCNEHPVMECSTGWVTVEFPVANPEIFYYRAKFLRNYSDIKYNLKINLDNEKWKRGVERWRSWFISRTIRSVSCRIRILAN
jgi:hypothetical protein